MNLEANAWWTVAFLRRWTPVLGIFLCVLLFPAGAQAQGDIQTIAGGGLVPASPRQVDIPTPSSVALDAAGNLYVAAATSQEILKISRSGRVSVFAGTGFGGFTGDGGPATLATLSWPFGIAFSQAGDAFIAEALNERVRRVDAKTGMITTVAGDGATGFSGDGGPAVDASLTLITSSLNCGSPVATDSAGNLFIADNGNNRIRRVDAATQIITTVAGNGTSGFSGDGGPATAAELAAPCGIALDAAGDLLIADTGNGRVRQVAAGTGIISTIDGQAFFNPSGLALDSTGDIFVADFSTFHVYRIDAITKAITTLAGNGFPGFSGDGGPATLAQLNFPTGVTVDAAGNLFIADNANSRIRLVLSKSQNISTFAGGRPSGDGGQAQLAVLANPTGVAADKSGNLYLLNGDNRIKKIDSAGIVTSLAGTGIAGFSGSGPATKKEINGPQFAITVDELGNVVFGDFGNFRIRLINTSSGDMMTIVGNGQPCINPTNLCGDGGLATKARVLTVFAVAYDSSGNLFFADSQINRIRRVDAISGIITTVAGNGKNGFSGDKGLATKAELNFPLGVAVDRNGNLFICDSGNNRVRRVDALTQIITTVAGNGTAGFSGDGGPALDASLNFPASAVVDASGDLFISDGNNNRVRVVAAATQIITTVAGNGVAGFSGDGGPATSAEIEQDAIALDAAGNLLIADAINDRVRLVPPPFALPSQEPPRGAAAQTDVPPAGKSADRVSLLGALMRSAVQRSVNRSGKSKAQ